MKVKISTIHFKADKKLEDFVQERLQKLSGIYDGVIGSDVTLKLDKNSTTENKVAEIKLFIKGNDLFAKKQCKSFEEATDTAVDALRKQLTKYKEKIQGL
ncbi:MAG TPA: ribosome-associated translation inhibitor RaiA [Bacteroidales bacterium]|nr:ribosome-associated translation inhibitor RaiA [Bacteroidales bacterium]HPS17244.1 ribosome-associated translation inhibitor RaiA [Bacteroidales bacterium]